MRRIALAIVGLWAWAGASFAADNVISRHSLIFNVIPTTPVNFGDSVFNASSTQDDLRYEATRCSLTHVGFGGARFMVWA